MIPLGINILAVIYLGSYGLALGGFSYCLTRSIMRKPLQIIKETPENAED